MDRRWGFSGAGITANASNKAAAVDLLEWMVSNEAQTILAGINMEFPVNAQIDASPIVASWGKFIADDINLSEAGRLQADAVRLMDKSGYR